MGLDSPAGPSADELASDEALFLRVLHEMFAEPGFLFPLVSAERQYREHYYGLSSAALLEDLFHDALANFLRRRHPTRRFERPGRGQRGWDYRFETLEVSHKVGKQPQAIAALWDATVEADTWSFQHPMAYLCSGYSPSSGKLVVNGSPTVVRPLSGDPSEPLRRGHRLWLVQWAPGDVPHVLWTAFAEDETSVSAAMPWATIWPIVATAIRAGVPANHLEVLRSSKAARNERLLEEEPDSLVLEFGLRSGLYFFPEELLQDVAVERNNRAVLLPKHIVQVLMSDSVTAGRFVPMPLWFRVFAGHRPPDLYLAQRAEYDERFSPARDFTGDEGAGG